MFYANVLGNLTRDAEIKTLSDGKELMKFTVAANGFTDKETVFCDVMTRYNEKLMPYLTKGQQIYLAGRCVISQNGSYVNVNVYPDAIQLCGTKKDESPAETPVA